MATKAEQYLDTLTAQGQISFTLAQLCTALNISHNAGLITVARLKKDKKVASPCKGYYLIVTPEFRQLGCLPADFFIDNLMAHLKQPYYVALLSASMFHGAAHQQPQLLQVMVSDKRKPIQCGHVYIEFIKNNELVHMPVQMLKTQTGYFTVSTPEATAFDMLRYVKQCGGIHRVATLLDELAESIQPLALTHLANVFAHSPYINRLGYLLDYFDHPDLALAVYKAFDHHSRIVPLVPSLSMVGAKRNKKWRLAINTSIMSDLDDT